MDWDKELLSLSPSLFHVYPCLSHLDLKISDLRFNTSASHLFSDTGWGPVQTNDPIGTCGTGRQKATRPVRSDRCRFSGPVGEKELFGQKSSSISEPLK